nr:monoterpene epsilon-lactone hydrolase [uncultured Acidithrix sp.]
MLSNEANMFRDLLLQMKHSDHPPQSVEEIRVMTDSVSDFSPVPDGVVITEAEIQGVVVEYIDPLNRSGKNVILYFHGGAYSAGSLKSHRSLGARLALASESKVVMADYRLAPENPFPAALEDSLKVYLGLLSNGVDPQNIVIGGDSAGGGLSLATEVAIRDGGHSLPGKSFLFSPWTDLTASGDSLRLRNDIDPMLDAKGMKPAIQIYLNGADASDHRASPLLGDLSGLPPHLVFVGTDEILFDDSFRLIEKFHDCNVEATLEVGEGLWHVWPSFPMPEADLALERVGEFILG